MSEYSFERVNKENLKDLLPIFKNAFGRDIPIEDLYRKMNTFNAPVSFLGMIGYYQKKMPCSYYGVYPVYANIKGNKELVSQSGDTMTHSEHVGRGLFYESAKMTFDLCAANGVKGVFGFPSKTSYPGFKKKLSWLFSDISKRYMFFVPTLPFSLAAEKLPFLRGAYFLWVRMILFFYKRGSYFKGSVVDNGQDGVWRDEAFWKYKMEAKPEIRIVKIGDANVIIKFNGKLSIGDMELNRETDLRPLIRKLKTLAFLTFNTGLVFYMSPGTVLDEKLKQIHPSTNGLPVGFLNFDNEVDLSGLKFTYFDFDTF